MMYYSVIHVHFIFPYSPTLNNKLDHFFTDNSSENESTASNAVMEYGNVIIPSGTFKN